MPPLVRVTFSISLSPLSFSCSPPALSFSSFPLPLPFFYYAHWLNRRRPGFLHSIIEYEYILLLLLP